MNKLIIIFLNAMTQRRKGNAVLLSIIFSTLTICFYSEAQSFVKTNQVKNSGKNPDSFLAISSNGAWCWFSDPRAVYYKNLHDRTYTGWIDSYGNIFISSYDHGTGKIEKKVLFDTLQADDHDNPSILFDSEGFLYIFFNKHGGPDPLYLVKSLKPEDISDWTTVKRLELNDKEFNPGMGDTYTYTNPVMLSGENDRIYLFWRGIDNKPNFSFSDDKGDTWKKGRIFILPERVYSMRRPYLKVYSDGKTKIHFAFTDGHPNVEKENSIYYMYYEKGAFYKANNKKIRELGDIPLQPRECDVVYDATITKQKAWIWDVAQDKEGKPVLVYTKFPNDTIHIYCYATWDRIKWNNLDLVNSGKWFPQTRLGTIETEPYYSGGLNIDKENTNIVYISVNRDKVFEIEKWETGNKGKSWKVEAITKGSSKDNVRPFAVRNAGEKNALQLLWMSNKYYVHWNPLSDKEENGYFSTIKTNQGNKTE
jgi:hypothetical protein